MIRLAKALLVVVSLACVSFAQPGGATAAPVNKAGAYYNFAMGRYYAEQAATYGNKNDYVTKAVEFYRQALKLDPGASFVFEELTDLYIQAGRLRDAVSEAEDLLKQSPDNLDARRMLGRIYTRMIGDTQQGRINEVMLKSATEQYQKITEKEPKDAESWVILGRLHRVANNSVEAEKAYQQALAAEPDNEDALTGLAMMYSDLGDNKRAIEKLKAATDHSPNEHTLAALANAYEQSRDYKNAADALQRALAIAPDNSRLKRALAQDLLLSENYDEALKLFTELTAEDPKDAQLRLRISEVYRAKRDWTKARESIDKAKQLDPDSMEVRYDEVNLFEAEGRPEQAIAALKSLLDETARSKYSAAESSNRAMLLERMGILYRTTGQFPKAIEAFRQIAALDAEGAPRVSVQIVDTYRAAKDFASAQREADAALRKFPDERMVKMAHASLLADLGKIDEAVAETKSLLKGDRDRETQLALAQIYEKGKRFDEMGKALDAAEKLSASDDDRETVFFMRGAMYERMKRFDAAETEFRKVLQSSPDNAGALNYLGYMLADRDVRLEEAHQLIKKAVDLDPQNGAYLDSLGWVYYRQGKLAEAEALFQQAIAKIGTDPTVHDHLGDVYFKLGKTKEAITQWQASLQAFQSGAQSDSDPDETARVAKKLESAKVKLAKETSGSK